MSPIERPLSTYMQERLTPPQPFRNRKIVESIPIENPPATSWIARLNAVDESTNPLQRNSEVTDFQVMQMNPDRRPKFENHQPVRAHVGGNLFATYRPKRTVPRRRNPDGVGQT